MPDTNWVAFILAVAMSGCAFPSLTPVPWQWSVPSDSGHVPQACPADAPSDRVELVPAWNAPAWEVASRLAGAAGDPLLPSDPEPRAAASGPWPSGDGSVRVIGTSDQWGRGTTRLHYSAPGMWSPVDEAAAREEAMRFLRRLRVADEPGLAFQFYVGPGPSPSLHFYQVVGEHPVVGTGGMISGDMFFEGSAASHAIQLAPIYCLSETAVSLSPADAKEEATRFARLLLDSVGRTAAQGYAHVATRDEGLQVVDGTLAFEFLVYFADPTDKRGGPCPGLVVPIAVDASDASAWGLGEPAHLVCFGAGH